MELHALKIMRLVLQLVMERGLERAFLHQTVALLAQVYDKAPELKANKQNWWQVFFCGAAALGSYLSSALHFGSMNVFDTSIQGANPLLAFVGGIFLLLGAKTMRACTSGHGLSGMALMSIASIVATMGIFGGGIINGVSVNRYL